MAIPTNGVRINTQFHPSGCISFFVNSDNNFTENFSN